MKPESEDYLAHARKDIGEAKAILAIGIARVAARCAYFAAFHAAEAAIFEMTGKVTKTHSGVHSEYARLTQDQPALSGAPHTFLAKAYRYKQEGDYGMDSADRITPDAAQAAVEAAELFVDTVEGLLHQEL